MSEIEETAKAAQEVAKASGKIADVGLATGGFFDRIFGKGLEDWVGRNWSDPNNTKRIEASIYDFEKLVTLAHDTTNRIEARGIKNFRAMAPKVVLPLLEHATMEDEEDLHYSWVALLANGVDADAGIIRRRYVTTLGEMTAEDRKILQQLVADSKDHFYHNESPDDTRTWGPGTDGTLSHDPISIITLNRLGIIEPAYIKFSTYNLTGTQEGYVEAPSAHDEVMVPGDLSSVRITEFGLAFVKAIGLDDDNAAGKRGD